MRNIINETITKEIELLHSVTCNKCGETQVGDEEGEYLHIHQTDVDFEGERNFYRSKRWQFDLCDKCLVEVIKTFKHAPKWFKGGTGEYAQHEFEKWVEDGCQLMSRF